MPVVTLKPSTPLYDSLRAQLSHDAHRQGVSAFPVENIPNSYFSNPAFARQLADFLAERIQTDQKLSATDRCHIYEFGAGTGRLGRNLLDALARHYPGVYARVVLHISDNSAAAVTEIQQSGLFVHHSAQVVFDILDMSRAAFAETAPPYFIYHTYLIDALPSHMLVWQDGQLAEFLVGSTVEADTVLVDQSVFPPVPMTVEGLAEVLSGEDWKTRHRLGTRILDSVSDYYEAVPIDHATLPDPDIQTLKQYFAAHSFSHPFAFAYSPVFAASLRIKAQYPDTMILACDFGVEFPDQLTIQSSLRLSYGLGAYMKVFFPVYQWLAAQSGLGVCLTPTPTPATYVLLIHNHDPLAAERLFVSHFSPDPELRLNHFLNRLKSAKTLTQLHTFCDEMERLYLSPEQLQGEEYLHAWFHTARALNAVDELWRVYTRLEADYPVSSPRYAVAMAEKLLAAGQAARALPIVQRALTLAPQLPELYMVQAKLAEALDEWALYQNAKRNELCVTRKNAVLPLFAVGYAAAMLNQPETCKTVYTSFMALRAACTHWLPAEQEFLARFEADNLPPPADPAGWKSWYLHYLD